MIRIEPIGNPYRAAVGYVAEHMRDGDRAELWALSRTEPFEALRASINASDEAYLAIVDDFPVAVLGNASHSIGQFGVPWFLGTDAVKRHRKELIKGGRKFVAHLMRTHKTLSNMVHADNAESVRFLKALGFGMSDLMTLPNGARAYTFTKERDADV